jgi:DNA-binding PadR family transcriptional regulator
MRDIFRETFLGFIRVHLLHHAAEERIFGTEMIEELAHHGYDLSPGTLYPILHAMEAAGYLASEQELVAGKLRRYYAITPEGLTVLEKLKQKVRELTHEVLNHDVGKPAAAGKARRKPRT